ncbi:hypothetical protein BT96DRAFT_981805 [Gymnopus androsaceus JB14]|uniref:F-box domain-containing protein n=1 Tax=Gymnopus androsaceus JB14 TaxID=1447944 RepID=A0A6A4GLR2_9AGAR|nr:hypothetical protein BT96DRAFT_981805 [Gymnopus androsaceus JB14]
MLLSSVPVDIILEIIWALSDLQDVLAFTLTCRSLQQLTHERSFWINCLKSTRMADIPLPLPPCDDLSAHSLSSLKNIALHTIRREKNFKSSNPRIMGSVRKTRCSPGSHDIISHIPGTEMHVTASYEDGMVTCWDISSEKSLASVYVGHYIVNVWRTLDPPGPNTGKISIALMVSDAPVDTYSDLVVLSVTYGPQLSNVSLQVIFRHRFESSPQSFSLALSLDSELVAIARTSPDLQIYVFNYSLGQLEPSILLCNLDFDVDKDICQVVFYNRNLYLVIERGRQSHLYRCAPASLPYNTALPSCSPAFEDDKYQMYEWSDITTLARPNLLVSMSDLELEGREPSLEFRVYDLDKVIPGRTVTDGQNAIMYGEIMYGTTIGTDDTFGFLLLHSSDLYLLFALNLYGEDILYLLTFSADGTIGDAVAMELPPSVKLGEAVSFTLDSLLGMVFVVTTQREIITIPFA